MLQSTGSHMPIKIGMQVLLIGAIFVSVAYGQQCAKSYPCELSCSKTCTERSQRLHQASTRSSRSSPRSSLTQQHVQRYKLESSTAPSASETMQELIYRVTQVSELQTMAAVQQLQLGKQYPDATGADGTWQTTVPGICVGNLPSLAEI